MDRSRLKAEAEAMGPWLVKTRRDLHAMPELGLEERRTADYIETALADLGIERTRRGTAIVGLVRGAYPGRTVALRADIDALPIREERDVPYRSRNEGAMHACGHDAHATILLGAARYFAERRESLEGNVKLLFQPAEEADGGAETMIRDGCLEDPRVDEVAGLHVMPYLPVGRVEVKKGALNGSSTLLKATIKGKSCHGAYPEQGIDAILIAAYVVAALHSLVGRYVSPLDQAVLTIGTIAGGVKENVIAEEVRLGGTMRTTNDAIRDALIERARVIVEGVAASFGGSGSLEAKHGYVALINHDPSVDAVAAAAVELLGPGSVEWKEMPSMGAEDFSFFLKERPGAFYHLGCGNPAKGICAPLHSPLFDIDEDCLAIGVAMQVCVALKMLERAKDGG
jgi:amidohydrolase